MLNLKINKYLGGGNSLVDTPAHTGEVTAGVEFRTGNYKDLLVPDESIIYCDPPIYGYHRIFRRYKPR